MTCHLDTQVVVWLAAGETEKLSPTAAEAIRKSGLAISPMVLLELQYLYEIKRILKEPLALLNDIDTQIGLKVQDASFAGVLHTALFETWTHDPFRPRHRRPRQDRWPRASDHFRHQDPGKLSAVDLVSQKAASRPVCSSRDVLPFLLVVPYQYLIVQPIHLGRNRLHVASKVE